jgi:hypothetical protein
LYCFCSAKFEREGREFERADGRHRHCHAGCLWLRSTKVRGPNVKIITIDDRFALRGPVDTAEEKRPIGEIADRIALRECGQPPGSEAHHEQQRLIRSTK